MEGIKITFSPHEFGFLVGSLESALEKEVDLITRRTLKHLIEKLKDSSKVFYKTDFS